MNRPSWDQTRMDLIRVVAKRSVCKHYKVAALAYRSKMPLSFGYNGPPKGEPHCSDIGCIKEDKNGNKLPSGTGGRCRGSHAEINVIANASIHNISLKECSIICIYSPCYACAKTLVNLGIVEFVYEKEYIDEFELVDSLFQRRGVIFRKF